jgi:superfamily II DNA or RNA helicase
MVDRYFVRKDANKAYISNKLWLPKSGVRIDSVKKALEFSVQSQGRQSIQKLWQETQHHIICPREFLPETVYHKYSFPFVDLRPEFPYIDIQHNIIPRSTKQELAANALLAASNGVLNLACGAGKTSLALMKIAENKSTALIIVPDGGIWTQWEDGIKRHLQFPGNIGHIREKEFTWQEPVVLASVNTLWRRILDGELSPELLRHFSLIIFDEVHQMAAPRFSIAAAEFYGNRIGLTATVKRDDGLDPMYLYHIGMPFYTDLSQDLIPEIEFQQTATTLDTQGAIIESTGVTNVGLLRGIALYSEEMIATRYHRILQLHKEGRKILCLSSSKNQLKVLHALFPGSALIISETDSTTRLRVLRDSNICFAISRLGATGADDDKLDTLIWLFPFKSSILLQQSMGRIQRLREGKKAVKMLVFDDREVSTFRTMCNFIRGMLKKVEMKFTNTKPNPNHRKLPPKLRDKYRAILANFQPEVEEEE